MGLIERDAIQKCLDDGCQGAVLRREIDLLAANVEREREQKLCAWQQLEGAVEALYSAHDFIGRVSAWTGDPDEAVELLDEIAKHLPAAGGRS